MARETTKWPSTRWPITKIMSSDGCNGNRVPLEMGPWYDFREFGCHLGNVGSVYGVTLRFLATSKTMVCAAATTVCTARASSPENRIRIAASICR